MNSLKEVFGAMQSRDHVKVAAARAARGLPPAPPSLADVDPELLKQAQDYDQIGRILAHHVFADMVKEAVDEAAPDASDEDKKKAVEEALAMARGEKKPDDEKKDDDKPKDGETEKQAAVRVAKMKKKKLIMKKMAEDPAYIAQLVRKYYAR